MIIKLSVKRPGLKTVVLHGFVRLKSHKPALKTKWFHSIDVPMSKPPWFSYKRDKEPEKFVPFSDYDGQRLEKAFLAGNSAVEVKEDRLFEVNIKKSTLSPIYWDGPIYEVRRGTWFDQSGIPLARDIAHRIEESYDKEKPFAGELTESRDSLVKELKKLPKEAISKYNEEIKRELTTERIDFSIEPNACDIGDDKAILFIDEMHAALFPSNISPFQLSVIRNFGSKAGTLLEVSIVQRGFTEDLSSSIIDSIKSPPVPSLSDIFLTEITSLFLPQKQDESKLLNDKMKSSENEKVLQSVMKSDYEDAEDPSTSKREVEHLILGVHGIGQILGHKYESVNFVHSINVFRNVMREIYQNDEKLQRLAHGNEFDKKNSQHILNNKIQVLPISWRHRLSFHPHKPFTEKKDADARLPSLSDINVDGVKALRNIVGDVILDVLLYYEPRYVNEIFRVVLLELNRVYKLYKERNPEFKGKVHILGHSLGSAIAFDLLSIQKGQKDDEYGLDFDVDNLFCVGSPLGMFKLLKRKNITPRSETPPNFDPKDMEQDITSPKCNNLYNIFHPSDPVSYRMEPLVKPEFANIKAEEVPYATKGISTQVRSLTTLGDDINQKLFSSWFKSKPKLPESVESPVLQENALGDIIKTLAAPGDQKSTNSEDTKQETMKKEDISLLTQLNRNGRVDYVLPVSVFSIALVSAISAHVSYFEDQETAAFVMKQVLTTDGEPVESKKVEVYHH